MSLARLVNQAIKTARIELGDLIQPAILRTIVSRSYVDGSYVPNTNDTPVEVAPDKFTFHEQQLEDYRQTDVKMILFNPDNNLEPSTGDFLVLDGREIPIIKAEPAYAGGYRPVWTLVLRK